MPIRPLNRCIVLTDNGTLPYSDSLVAFDGTSGTPTPAPNPAFTSSPSISHDGTPQVGETLTGVDGAVTNGAIATRQWLLNGSAIGGANGSTYVPTEAGSFAFRETATGAAGTTPATSTSAAITVAATTPMPTVYFAVATISATEGNSGTKDLVMTAKRSSTAGALNVTTTFVQGSAGPADFAGNVLPGNKVFAFANGSDTATQTVTISGDTDVESDETFGYQLVAPAGWALASPSSVTGTILNDDQAGASVMPAPPTYADSFSTNSTPLTGRANWAGASIDKWAAADGILKIPSSSGLYDDYGYVTYGPDLTDFEASFTLYREGDTDAFVDTFAPTAQFWYQDNDNRWSLSWQPGQAQYGYTYEINCISGGQQQLNWRFAAPDSLYPTKAVVTLTARGKEIGLFVDGKAAFSSTGNGLPEDGTYPFATKRIPDAVAAAARHGKLGFYTRIYRVKVADDVTLSSKTVAITRMPNFVGRSAAGGSGGVLPIEGNFTGAPTGWVYRLIHFETRAELKGWAAFTPTVSGSTFTANLPLPVGGPYMVELGWTGSDGLTRTTRSIDSTACGVLVGLTGQSNSDRHSPYDPLPDDAAKDGVAVTYSDYANHPAPANTWYTASYKHAGVEPHCGKRLAEAVVAATGVPCGLVVKGYPGASLAEIVSRWDEAGGIAETFAATTGVMEFVVWDQGEGDADGAYEPTGYAAAFKANLLPKLRASTRNQAVKVMLAPVGRWAAAEGNWANGIDSRERADRQREVLRQQYLQIVADAANNAAFGSFKLGLVHGDAYHYTPAAYTELCRRDGLSIGKALGGTLADGRGPLVTAAARTGATITLSIDLNGATALTDPASFATGDKPSAQANTVLGYQVSADNFATLLPINSVARSGNSLTITLASAPSGAVKVRSFYGASYDDTSLFTGIYAGGIAPIPVAPIQAPITSN